MSAGIADEDEPYARRVGEAREGVERLGVEAFGVVDDDDGGVLQGQFSFFEAANERVDGVLGGRCICVGAKRSGARAAGEHMGACTVEGADRCLKRLGAVLVAGKREDVEPAGVEEGACGIGGRGVEVRA